MAFLPRMNQSEFLYSWKATRWRRVFRVNTALAAKWSAIVRAYSWSPILLENVRIWFPGKLWTGHSEFPVGHFAQFAYSPARKVFKFSLINVKEELNSKCVLGGVYMISGRLSSRRKFTPVPSYGSVFVYMITTQNVMPVQVIPARVYPGSCAGARFSSRHENSFRSHVNGVWLFVSYPLKFHQFYGTIRLAPNKHGFM